MTLALRYCVMLADRGRCRNYRAPLRGGEDFDGRDGGIYDKEELPRAVHQRC